MECLLAGRTLQRCRTAFLDETRSATAALLLGEGNGRFLAEFLDLNKNASVVCLDASSRMLRLARQRTAPLDRHRVRFIHADLLAPLLFAVAPADLGGPFDLVVTHFFLDCFRGEQLDTIVEIIRGRTSSEATWLLADFRVPETGFPRLRAKAILWLAYSFFRIVTQLPARRITPPDSFLQRLGFVLQKRIICEHGLLHSDLWRRDNGASATNPQIHMAESISSSPPIKTGILGCGGTRLL